jgi:chromosome condensin MukBEF complex kleisin-like MukF subunit
MTDSEIEAAAKKAGGRWNGDAWVFEDADFHPFVRTLLAAERDRWAAVAQRLHEAGDRSGVDFCNDDAWQAAYAELRGMCGLKADVQVQRGPAA